MVQQSGTIYESFADMMSPEDAKRYLDFLENGSREGLTSAELAGVEKADTLLVSQKVGYEGVWDSRNAGDLLESGLNSNLLDELANSGVKYNPEDIVAITKTADGKLVWLENGTDTVGLNHIITEHADDFLNKGIMQEQIPNYVMNALENGKIVGYQGIGILKDHLKIGSRLFSCLFFTACERFSTYFFPMLKSPQISVALVQGSPYSQG